MEKYPKIWSETKKPYRDWINITALVLEDYDLTKNPDYEKSLTEFIEDLSKRIALYGIPIQI